MLRSARLPRRPCDQRKSRRRPGRCIHHEPASSTGQYRLRSTRSAASILFSFAPSFWLGFDPDSRESYQARAISTMIRVQPSGQSHECRTHQPLPLQGGGREGDGVIWRLFRRSIRRSRPIPTPSLPLKGRGRAFMRFPWCSPCIAINTRRRLTPENFC